MHTYTDIHGKRTLTGTAAAAARACLLAAVTLGVQLHGQMGLGLTPMRLEFPAKAGAPYSGTLVLSNSSADTVRARTELLDFYVDGAQTPQFPAEAPDEKKHSCRQWLTVNPMEVEIGPKKQLPVRYTVRVPADATEKSFHCAIGFVTLPTADELKGIGVRTAVRVVATLYPIVGQPEVKGSIASLGLEPVAAGESTRWRGIVVMDNPGEILYRPKGSLEVVDGGGKVVERVEMVSFPVLPMRQQRFLLPLKQSLAAGRYTLRAEVDLGPEVQEATAEVTAASQGR